MRKKFVFFVFFLFNHLTIQLFNQCQGYAQYEAKVMSLRGEVTIDGRKVSKGVIIEEGDEINTGAGAKAVIKFPDRAKITLEERSRLKVKELERNRIFNLQIGKVEVSVKKLRPREKFQVHTPVSVCAIRGTRFSVEVKADRTTTVKVFEGVIAARWLPEEEREILIHPHQQLEIPPDEAPSRPTPIEEARRPEVKKAFAELVKEEVRMDMTKEQVQAAAAQEIKLAEYQQGKALIDVFGKRVRVEEYIVRPIENQFKMVVLNEREKRFDYFTWKASFDKSLPTDLTLATRWVNWKQGAAPPDYYLTKNERGASNTVDKVEWTEQTSQNQPLYQDGLYKSDLTLTSYKINNQEKLGLGIEKFTQETYIDNLCHHRYYAEFSDGSWAREEYYSMDDEGEVASKEGFELLKYNEELVFTASEFTGPEKKIDLVVEPKIFVDSGLIE